MSNTHFNNVHHVTQLNILELHRSSEQDNRLARTLTLIRKDAAVYYGHKLGPWRVMLRKTKTGYIVGDFFYSVCIRCRVVFFYNIPPTHRRHPSDYYPHSNMCIKKRTKVKVKVKEVIPMIPTLRQAINTSGMKRKFA